MDLVAIVAATLIALIAGVLTGWILRGRSGATTAGDARMIETRTRLASADATVVGLRQQLDQQGRQYQTQVHELMQRVRELQDRVETMKQLDAARAEEDGRVLTALSPVATQLKSMQEKVAELERQRQLQHGELSEQLRQANESEERLRATAESLASALRSNSTRGVWGETQLRSVVEAAGLLHRVDFDVQASIDIADGIGRPDMVVHLPGGKSIAVDAKVPFNAYLEANAIPATAGEAELARRELLIKQHVKALRDHITTLGSKAYWTGLSTSPELVIAFIPSEGLVSAALDADPSIMEFAFSKRVALSSPVTLWSVLKTVAFSWQQQAVTEDAKKLFDVSRELYSRLSTTAGHLEKLGRSIKASVSDYNKYVGSMERQVLPSARRLVSIDEAKVIGELSEIEDAPRAISASEMLEGIEEVKRRIAADEDETVDLTR